MKKVVSTVKVLLAYVLFILTYTMLCPLCLFSVGYTYTVRTSSNAVPLHILGKEARDSLECALAHSENNVELVEKIQIFRL